MTEHQIECRVERMVNAADRAFMGGHMTQAEYDEHIHEIDQWAKKQYAAAVRS